MQEEKVFHGIATSPGIAIGSAIINCTEDYNFETKKIDADLLQEEILRFQRAVEQVKKDLASEQQKIAEEIGEAEAAIWSIQLLLIDDPEIYDEVIKLIRTQHVNAESAVKTVLETKKRNMAQLEDDYMRQRASDLEDLQRRLVISLSGKKRSKIEFSANSILVTDELTPTSIVQIDKDKVKGIVTEKGGSTSHAAILVKSLALPAVFGASGIMQELEDGWQIIVDGSAGLAIVNPETHNLEKYYNQLIKQQKELKEHDMLKDLPAVTTDGCKVELAANISSVAEANHAFAHNADGIGLFRTEFLFMDTPHLPNEDEQFEVYKAVALSMQGKPVIIRTLDAGGDKKPPGLNIPHEANPFLGWRAIRICLAEPDILKNQLKAILRAANFGNVWVMFPMITSVEEIRQAKAVFLEAMGELVQSGKPFNSTVKIGIMIETPAAVLLIDALLQEVDFVSIGTNDLTQYTLATDRMNAKVAYLYDYFHPAVLRQLKYVVERITQAKKWVGICGEMAGDPLAVPLLIGLGFDELSVTVSNLNSVKSIVRAVSKKEAAVIAEEALRLETVDEIKKLLKSRFHWLVK
ncbi:phosphoenolpyruvate--protein phosphotransferase [Zhaonella formicivorans]|uniref:phosphoenolpyruvate--protein phosphotransferase n=1 Tax=Zhaonella formicivorans TaxID=2528593 RepID=UPI001D1002CC|nr:phosphoenolpyruvate--protein phosphotransferase [Zhaonella formicivorans]